MATGLDIGLSNFSLSLITLSFYTMCKSTTPVFLLFFCFAWGLERCVPQRCHLSEQRLHAARLGALSSKCACAGHGDRGSAYSLALALINPMLVKAIGACHVCRFGYAPAGRARAWEL